MFGGPTEESEAIRIVHRALDEGVNFVDTADVYHGGASEVAVGKAVAGRRSKVVVATKGRQPTGAGPNEGGAGRKHLMQALDDSLRRLNTDYVDLYYQHAPDDQVPIEETLRAMDDMVRSGKVRYIGCSNFRAWQLCAALWTSDRLNLYRFACVQPLYNIVNRDIEVELLPLCRHHGIGVVSYSPLARGILTGKYRVGQPFSEGSRAARNDVRMKQAELRDPSIKIAEEIVAYCEQKNCTASQFALAWCLANPLVSSIVVGPRTGSQLHDNLQCLNVSISESDETFINGLNPPGEHSGKGFPDPVYPVTGR